MPRSRKARWCTPTSTTSTRVWRIGATATRRPATPAVSTHAMTMATGSARCTSTRPRAYGPCCAPGSDRTGVSRRRSCRSISASSSSSTTPAAGARLCSLPSSRAWSGRPMLTTPKLDKSHLENAKLRDAVLVGTYLQGANLVEAKLQGADLRVALLQGAGLVEAQLQGAELDGAQLQGVYLDDAQLQGAELVGAQLQGAELVGAQLQG